MIPEKVLSWGREIPNGLNLGKKTRNRKQSRARRSPGSKEMKVLGVFLWQKEKFLVSFCGPYKSLWFAMKDVDFEQTSRTGPVRLSPVVEIGG